MKHRRSFMYLVLVLFVLFALAACSDGGSTTTETVEVTRIVEVPGECPDVEAPTCPEVEPCPECPAVVEPVVSVVPFEAQWAGSAHADKTAEAFVHWNEDDPQEVPANCAKCHSTPGFQDFLGADGTEAGVVDNPAPIGTVITCEACHNDATLTLTSVVFPSGAEITGLGPEARCMQCHQGRASKLSVDESIANAGLAPEDVDTVSPDLGFTNIHYYAAAATQYGKLAMGGYEYDGKSYDSRFDHVEGYNTCSSCHDPHTLEVRFEDCQGCHADLRSADDLVDIRMNGSLVDYDGNGNMDEGIYYEIEGLRAILYTQMQAYATEVAGTPILYNESAYPYFFIDTNGDGEGSEDELTNDNRYNAWTPRLAKAAYNYQVSLKDPGRFAHGAKYVIQLLYDSIEDLNAAVSSPIDMTTLRRIDHGHFAGSEEAFRHWDGEEDGGIVPGTCSRCHSAAGLPLFIDEGVSIAQPASNGLACATCHNDLQEFTIREIESVPFPSGATLATDDLGSNLCISCHQGRESTVSVNRAINGLDPDTPSENLRFRNIHYFAAAVTLFGTEAKGAYEYTGQEYNGRNEHVGAFNTCNECHSTHALEVVFEECAECHETVATKDDLMNIRVERDEGNIDYDGDGDATEGIANEIATMREILYASLQAYAADVVGTPIFYNPNAYPYFFVDDNGNGVADEGESTGYNAWTPRSLTAAYNYQYTAKDPGAFAHNGQYVMQILYDSINDLGGDVTAMSRPPVAVPEAAAP